MRRVADLESERTVIAVEYSNRREVCGCKKREMLSSAGVVGSNRLCGSLIG